MKSYSLILGMIVLALSACSKPSPQKLATAKLKSLPVISLATFGSVGTGGDDTAVFQKAINSTASASQTLHFPAGSYHINPISFPSNFNGICDAGVTVTANSGIPSGSVFMTIASQNVTIMGPVGGGCIFKMLKAEYSGEYTHCMQITGASNVTISWLSCNDSGGDGLYLRNSSTVTVSDSTFNNNHRQGSSIVGLVSHIFYERDHFTNTFGTAPAAGLDIEPNSPGDFLLDVNIDDCTASGNQTDGFMVSLWLMDKTSQPVDVKFHRDHSDHNSRYGFVGINNDPSNAPGAILCDTCTSDSDASDGFAGRFFVDGGASLTFLGGSVTNPHNQGPDPSYGDSAGVSNIRGGGGSVPLGNVHFLGVNITATNGKMDRYFILQDGSGQGNPTNDQFDALGTLSGATNKTANGTVNGTWVNTVGPVGPPPPPPSPPPPPQSGVISYKFVGTGIALAPTEVAGVVPSSGWLNIGGASGNAPGITWKGDSLWVMPFTDAPGNTRLMRGYLDSGSMNPSTVTITGLASGVYDVYVYADGDNRGNSRAATYSIAASGTMTAMPFVDNPNSNFSGTLTPFVLHFTGVPGPAFTLTAIPGTASDGTKRAPLNAIQIVPAVTPPPPPPPPVATLAVSCVPSGASLVCTWTPVGFPAGAQFTTMGQIGLIQNSAAFTFPNASAAKPARKSITHDPKDPSFHRLVPTP